MSHGHTPDGSGRSTGHLDGITGHPTPDGQLKPALTRLADAISALCDVKPVLVQARTEWLPSLYNQLADAVSGQTGERNGSRISAPLWPAAVDLKIEIDTAAHCWQPLGDGTADRLWRLHDRGWRPQDTSSVEELADNIQSWAAAVTKLLDPPHVFELRAGRAYAACPYCHATVVKVHRDGELVRQAALTISVEYGGCICHGCGHTWPPALFGLLVREMEQEFDTQTGS